MVINCPLCQVKLKLPEDMAGKRVRCPSCDGIFDAPAGAHEVAVQEGAPAVTPTSVAPAPSWEDSPAPKPRPRFNDDYDRDTDDNEPARDEIDDLRDEQEATLATARRVTRTAGVAMLMTGCFVLVNITVNGIMTFLSQGDLAPPPGADAGAFRAGQIAGLFCVAFIFLPMIGFVIWGGSCLIRLGSRGIIITGVVMTVLLLLLLGGGLAINVVVLSQGMPIPLWVVLPTVILNSISCLLCIASLILAIIALGNRAVSTAYLIQAESGRARRRY
ncbi:MAG: hypothetical protein HYX68_20670 [Planctomycetes bacterium]|nr:hypothetical protein [Planctomycetota bacterium]